MDDRITVRLGDGDDAKTRRARITIRLSDDEFLALCHLAEVRRRDVRDQAGLIVREGLERVGYQDLLQFAKRERDDLLRATEG